ncbi:MAG: glycoside hydrolase family 16 protein, partial [Actinomycetota bacterium]|nr:glycoside hydrolase family 16 protein [Actinomycetota bacterium]
MAQELDEIIAKGYELEVEDRFDSGRLDESLWFPYYLPQWSSREQAAARYELREGSLHLLIERDQPPWCPALDGPTRVSSLQTGVFAGPRGSKIGQHRFKAEAVVQEEQPPLRLYTPRYGVFALRAAALDDPACMVALWMIGYEDRPERSGEICICEIFGRDVGPNRAAVGVGVHPFADPDLRDDFERVSLPIDARASHEYAAEWTPEQVAFFVDGRRIKTVEQSPTYPMQFMLNVYEFGEPTSPASTYPKRFVVEGFRA